MKKKTNNFLSRFKIIFNRDKERLNSSVILIKGSLITCIILSIASGFIDITFFSGLSKSLLHIGTIPMFAAVLYTVISIGFISAKFWCAMKIGMIRELKSRLEARAFSWADKLWKALVPWHIAHKFLIVISIITALSLSVNSIGSALKDAERNTTNITISIDELQALKKQKRADNNDKRNLARSNLEGTATASSKAQENADKYWYIFENWQKKLSNYKLQLESLEDEEERKALRKRITEERQSAFDSAPRGIGLTLSSMDDMSPIILKNLFATAAKKTETDKESLAAFDSMINDGDAEIRNTISALENLYKHPTQYDEKGYPVEGKTVSFLDENGELMDVTQVIGILQGLREEWKENTDIGESAQIFMLVSELIAAKSGNSGSSGSGAAETLMMIFIAIAGIVQEFLIAIFTPKAAIDRKLLSQVSQYLLWKNKEEKERFLISVYTDYVGDGIINQEEFENKCKKCVSLMEETEDDIVYKYSSKKKKIEKPISEKTVKEGYSKKVDETISEIDSLLGIK